MPTSRFKQGSLGKESFIDYLAKKILKTNKAGEAISGHFLRAMLPSVNEQFQRILLPFILYALFKYKI